MTIPFLIIGQGLAGSLLAWELMQREQRVLIVDRLCENSASRVAAGLINPITGQRLVKASYVDQCLPVAMACYAQLQQEFKRSFYHVRPMLRLFASPADKDRYLNRRRDQDYQMFLGDEFVAGESGQPITEKKSGFTQRETGYLDITALLDSLRSYFLENRILLNGEFNFQDMKLSDGIVQWQDQMVDRVIFCEGARAIENPWFRWLPFQLSKGEIITVRSSVTLPDVIINNGHWLLPCESNLARVGATYEWEWMEQGPTQKACQQLVDAGRLIVGDVGELEVVAHRAGIRPTTRDKSPLLGAHPDHPALNVFNGFGSKGSLMIPFYAQCMANYLVEHHPLPENEDIARFDSGKSITTLARRYISETIRSGDIVIDATVGNGHDTEFAARCVGLHGHVFGFDIQQQAIDTTHQRLLRSGMNDRVTLFNSSHEQLTQFIPAQYHGQISSIIFNLGYLPGDNKQVVTHTKTTIVALQQALALLKLDGRISIVSYRGHDGGKQEADDLLHWVSGLENNKYQVKMMDPNHEIKSPFLVIIHKLV